MKLNGSNGSREIDLAEIEARILVNDVRRAKRKARHDERLAEHRLMMALHPWEGAP